MSKLHCIMIKTSRERGQKFKAYCALKGMSMNKMVNLFMKKVTSKKKDDKHN